MLPVWRVRLSRNRALYLLIATYFLLVPCAGAYSQRRTTIVPAPLSIPPSQDWDGNDGPWSSFTVQVGTPAQALKVFISTAGSQTWVVAEEGCQPGEPSSCPKQRGGLYNYTASTSWVPNLANISNDIYTLDLDASLGYDGNGRYGFDDITLGFQGGDGPHLNNQTVAGIALKSFFLGLLGLAAKPSTFTSQNISVPSLMQNLKNQSKIPSISWGYTAGNQYRLNEVLGSLTLGGYDAGRFTSNNSTFPFSTIDRGELSVQVQSITTGSGSISLLPSPISAYLDSSVPYIYLPVEACALFETAFGISWNDTAQLYFISDMQRTLMEAQNPSVVFTLGAEPPNQVNISLPYIAFDLTASWPLVANATRYFPLRRANDSTQYTLGRAFFQEAYMIADYERQNFSVSQCKWDSSPQTLVPILSPDAGGGSAHTLPIGIIAGIAAGGAVLVLAAAVLLFIYWWKPRRRKRVAAELAANNMITTATTTTMTAASKPVQEYYKPELDSSQVPNPPEIVIHEADGTKITPPVEMEGNHPIYEMPGPDKIGELPASPVSTTRGRSARFSWSSNARSSILYRSITPEAETMSSISSGWGDTNRSISGIVNPATPEEKREHGSRQVSPGGS